MFSTHRLFSRLGLISLLALAAVGQALAAGDNGATASFAGPKANTGSVTFEQRGNDRMLTLSADFQTPDTPDPHWQVVDSRGNVITLERIPIKESRENRSITLPSYVRDVAKVVIWCSFAEANLGEAVFARPVK